MVAEAGDKALEMRNKDVQQEQLFEFNSALSALLAGALAGACAKTAIAPLDRTKIYFQINASRPYSLKAALNFIVSTYRENGFFALFRGNSAMMIRVMPYAAIQFAAFEQFKILLEVDRNGTSTPIRRFLSGTLAAMSSTCLTYPLDVARTRFATNHAYHTLRAVFVEEYRRAGLGGFYRGFVPTIMGMIPYAGMSFFTYTTLKLHYKEYTGRPTGPVENFIFGGFSGIVGQTTSYPFDIIRRRMQTDKLPRNSSVFEALLQIARAEGFIGGWYKGLSMNWIKGPISTGIVFSTYDMIFAFTKDLLQRR